MMEKAYILENGILELYVLGELNLAECQQVEQSLDQHLDLRELKSEIEISFENIATDNGVDVPESVKNQLLNSISKKEIKTMSTVEPKNQKTYFWIAASIAGFLFLGSIYLLSELNSLQKEFEIVSEKNKDLGNQNDKLNASLKETSNWYDLINNPETSKYVLKGNNLMPEATVIGYVNFINESVVVNTKNLPELDAQHDYQMWADVEGVMINMGIIDKSKEMLAMNYIDHAESLNITIEEKGGSDHPNVSQLVTNIYLK